MSDYEEDFAELVRDCADYKEALLAIKVLCAGDKIPNWKDDWATTTTRGRIMDIVDATVR